MSNSTQPKILHCHSTFAAGGKELRSAKLMNAFGSEADHAIVSGMPNERGAQEHLDPKLCVEFLEDFPSLNGWPTPGRLVKIAQAMSSYDLILTYNWGAIDAVMAHTVFAEALGLPPLIHHEDGFNEDEAESLKRRRNWYRRVALGRTHSLVVPSQTLENIALNVWRLPAGRIRRIPNGIDTKSFARAPKPESLRVVKREGERWIGTLAGLRPVKQLPMLVRACADLPESWHLVILGDGPEKEAIAAEAQRLEVSHRVHLPGAIADPASVVGLFDIFALSSRSEQFPLSVVEAMAAGLPVVAPDVGDIKRIVAEPNRAFIAADQDSESLGNLILELAMNADLRVSLGKANRLKAQAQFDVSNMIESYRRLYWEAMGRPV